MGIFKRITANLAKFIVVVLAVGNLISLFVFDFSPLELLSPVSSVASEAKERKNKEAETETKTEKKEEKEKPEAPAKTEQAGSDWQILVPAAPLTYDAASVLNLSEGVVVVDGDGTEHPEITITSSVASSSVSTEKTITYSAVAGNDETLTAVRTLQLPDSYAGPSIQIDGELPAVSKAELDSLASVLAESGVLSADDGLGNDAVQEITSRIDSESDEEGLAQVTLTLVNMLDDSDSVTVDVPLAGNKPILRLTASTVTLKVGDLFSIYDYIAAAEDVDGTSLFNTIIMDGTVDTRTAGTYTLDFHCVNAAGESSPVKTLTVIVE